MAEGPKTEMKPQVYKDPRPAEYFTRFHARTRAKRPNWMYELVRLVLTPVPAAVLPHPRDRLGQGAGRRPRDRRAQPLLVPRPLLRRRLPAPQGAVHGEVAAVQEAARASSTTTAACSRCGAATATTEAFKTAHAVLARGGIVVMYCEGGRSRTGELGEPKPGIGRLALESGAPVVPVALVGSERVRDWKRLQFPKVSVQFGDPIRFEQVEEPIARAVAGGLGADLRAHPRPVAGAARERPQRHREGRPRRPPRRRGGRAPSRQLA